MVSPFNFAFYVSVSSLSLSLALSLCHEIVSVVCVLYVCTYICMDIRSHERTRTLASATLISFGAISPLSLAHARGYINEGA
jgi:hypothetical protein